MKLVVQIPALDEEATVADVIARIPRDIEGISSVTVLVIDDGSSDRTGELAREAGAMVIRNDQPQGVGAAFRTGIQRSTELAMAGRRYHDVSCGFRAYSRNAYLRLVLTGNFTYTHEVFLTLAYAGLSIREVPLKVQGVREHGTSRIAPGVIRYGLRTGAIILRTYRDYKPLRFFAFLSILLGGAALCFFAFLMYTRITTGAFTPHKWAGFVAATFGGSALIVFLVGIVAEMLDRSRITQEETLYRVRKLEIAMQEIRKMRSPE